MNSNKPMFFVIALAIIGSVIFSQVCGRGVAAVKKRQKEEEEIEKEERTEEEASTERRKEK